MKEKKLMLAIISVITICLVVATAVVCGVFGFKNSTKGLEYSEKSDRTYAVTGIGTCKNTDVVISPYYKGKKVTNIGAWAFYNCYSLTSITIPDSVTSIGDRAFSDCTELTSITIPDSVTSIGDCAFYYCCSLTSIVIPSSVTNIGDNTFIGCTKLTSITIPDSVTSIGSNAFAYCNSLDRVYFGGDKASWEDMTIGYLNEDLLDADVYFYSENKMDGNYWRYVNGVPIRW